MGGELLNLAAGMLGAVSLGAMLFFAAVVAPLVFTRLPEETAGRFIRELFPWYYLALGLLTGLAAAAAARAMPGDAVVFGAVCAGFVYARQVLMPRINHLRDRELGGDPGAAAPFQREHRRSVLLNGLQMAALFALTLRALA